MLDLVSDRGLTAPAYDRTALVPRIVHIGVGGFHRAHLAAYCHELAERGSDWGICGVGLLDGDRAMAEVLRRQDHLYTLTTRHRDTIRTTIIGSIVDYVLAAADTTLGSERIARPEAAIVSLTVTEAGYTDNDRNHRTFDMIAAGLAQRRSDGVGGLTILSCDNITGNGDVARRCVLDAARRRDDSLAEWVATACSFPNSMVDRITPATTDHDRRFLIDSYGLIDEWPVAAESFRQWVLEDDFVAGRPDIGSVGAVLTDDVHAWELYKLRLLNAGHTAIAHLAALAGITHVDEALAVPELHQFLRGFLLDESAPTLTPIPDYPPHQYVAEVLDRFANTGIRDQIARICIDSTAKFANFVIPVLADQLARGGRIDHIAHTIAAWAHYLATIPVARQAADPEGDRVRPLAHDALDDPVRFIDERVGFPSQAVHDTRLVNAFAHAHGSIARHGALAAVRQLGE